MIYELSISADYRPEWGTWEGLREVIQNMFDAGTETGKGAGYWHDGKAGHFVSHGARLETSSLLLGETSKTDNAELIGQFGDGMKVGAIALLRKGHTVTMTQPGERWHFSLRKSRRYAGKTTLQVDVRKHGQSMTNGTTFTVGKLNVADYNQAMSRFLPIDRMKEGIVRDANPGDIYVKGVFVMNMPGYKYAYNMPKIELGPDRKVLDAWSLDSHRFYAFYASLMDDTLPFGEALDFLESGSEDAEFPDYYGGNMPSKFGEHLQQVFLERYGANSYPAFSDEDARKLQFAGYGTMRPATKFLQYAYYAALGTSFSELLQNAGKSSKLVEDLTTEERAVWLQALQLLELQDDACVTQVVEFADDNILGSYGDNTIKLARKQLRSLPEALATLLHEKAHWVSCDADGTPGFQAAMHTETVKLLEGLL